MARATFVAAKVAKTAGAGALGLRTSLYSGSLAVLATGRPRNNSGVLPSNNCACSCPPQALGKLAHGAPKKPAIVAGQDSNR